MLRFRSVISVAVLLWAGESPPARTILYVDQNATGPIHDGWTWCTAFTDLQDAMEGVTWDVTIRVADGTYVPDRGTGDTFAAFHLTTNVAVEGGYAGCGASEPDERDVGLYKAVLTGDLGGNDVGDLPSREENSRHVVRASGTDNTAVLDGFTITGGYARVYYTKNGKGAGMYNTDGDPTVRHCTFLKNYASHYGGGIYNLAGNPSVSDCLFIGNSAGLEGGGIYNDDGYVLLRNCTFHINLANSSRASGGSVPDSRTELLSCILWDGGYEIDNTVTASFNNIYGGWPGANIFLLPQFVDADGPDDIPGTGDDDLRLLPDSPCIDTGDPGFEPEPDDVDLDGNRRVINGLVDMGAYEYLLPCDDVEDCDDGDACTVDVCDLDLGCVYTVIECDAGYVCVDGSCEVVCELMDADGDGDIDLRDHAVWQNCFSGPLE